MRRAVGAVVSELMTHRPGPGGLFASETLCGAGIPSDGVTPLRMHEWEYDCPDCARLSGEAVDSCAAPDHGSGSRCTLPFGHPEPHHSDGKAYWGPVEGP